MRLSTEAIPKSMPLRTVRAHNQLDSAAWNFAKYTLTVLLFVGIVGFLAFVRNRKSHTVTNLRSECRKLDAANIELSKNFQNRYAELERLKDGRFITAKARALGLRPPDETQTVQRLRLVSSERGLKIADPVIDGMFAGR